MVGAPLLKMLPAWLKPEPELEDRSAGKNLILVHVEPAAECGCEGQVDAALEVSVLTFGAKYFMQFLKKMHINSIYNKRPQWRQGTIL